MQSSSSGVDVTWSAANTANNTWNITSAEDEGVGSSTDNDSSVCSEKEVELDLQLKQLQSLQDHIVEEKNNKSVILRRIFLSNRSFDQERLNAEKDLLLTSLKTQLFLDEFTDHLKIEAKCDLLNIGTVTISHIKLEYIPSNSASHIYFICVLNTSNSLIATDIEKLNSNNTVHFQIEHTFKDLKPDFEIVVKIYFLMVPKKNFFEKLVCFQKNNSSEEKLMRNSLFTFWKKTSIQINNINESGEIILDLVQSKLSKLLIDVSTLVDASCYSWARWLDASQNGKFWTQKWCVLKGTYLTIEMHPDSRKPIIIDLKLCASVTTVKEERCGIKRIITLKIQNIKRIEYYYLSPQNKEEFDLLSSYLQRLVATVQIWKRHQCFVC